MRLLVLIVALAACADRELAARGPVRLVSLHDVTTEMVVALGVTDRLVGVAEPVDVTPAVQRAIAGVPRVGALESVVAVHPDVVLGLGVIEERDPELVERLRARGVDVLLANPATIDDVYALTRAVAARAGTSAETLVATLQQRVARSTGTSSNKRVFVYDCCDPPFTAARDTVLTDLIARAGGANVFADLATDWTSVSWEAAVARRPDVIVIHSYAYDGQGDVADKRRALSRIPALAGLPTIVMPLGEALGGLRSVDGLTRLREGLR